MAITKEKFQKDWIENVNRLTIALLSKKEDKRFSMGKIISLKKKMNRVRLNNFHSRQV